MPNTTGAAQAASARSANLSSIATSAVRIPDGYMAIGMITSAHGLRGEVKVELHTDFPERFAPERYVSIWAKS